MCSGGIGYWVASGLWPRNESTSNCVIIPLVWLHVLKKCLCVWFARTREYWTRCCRISWRSLAILTPELTPMAGRARLLWKQHERLDKMCILLVMLCLKHGSVAFNNLWKSCFWSSFISGQGFLYLSMCKCVEYVYTLVKVGVENVIAWSQNIKLFELSTIVEFMSFVNRTKSDQIYAGCVCIIGSC